MATHCRAFNRGRYPGQELVCPSEVLVVGGGGGGCWVPEMLLALEMHLVLERCLVVGQCLDHSKEVDVPT